MRRLLRKHARRITPGHGIIIAVFLISSVLVLDQSGTPSLSFISDRPSFSIGEVGNVAVHIETPTPINATGMIITYSSELVRIVDIETKGSFIDLWTQEPIVRADGEIHLSGGTLIAGGLTGTSTVLDIEIEAKQAGTAVFAFKNSEIIASDGSGTALKHTADPLSIQIVEKSAAPQKGGGGSSATATPTTPIFDLNADGRVTLVDVSILLVHMFAAYDRAYDFDTDGSIGLSDLSALLARVQ